MLYADKAALENRTKLRLLAIRERELTLYTQNCFTIGTVSALMAGLAYSSLLYTKMDYFQDATAFVQAMYVMGNVISMYLALRAMTGTTMIAMFGPGKVRIACDGPAPCPSPLRAPEPRFTQKRRAGRRCAAPTVRCTRRWTPCLRSLRRPAPPSIAFQSLAKAWPYSLPLPHPHHSPLTTHHSPLINSPLTTHHPIFDFTPALTTTRRASPSKVASTLSSSASSSTHGAQQRPAAPHSACCRSPQWQSSPSTAW